MQTPEIWRRIESPKLHQTYCFYSTVELLEVENKDAVLSGCGLSESSGVSVLTFKPEGARGRNNKKIRKNKDATVNDSLLIGSVGEWSLLSPNYFY